ncbi:hypothetical protein BaRGS_00009878 [Batillaria attramentaria]|uniref:Uncharacterized protein n=1 Tax=Batillaria attramentaria TaxID=370345 RepID=A0ABD0LHP6_9CAEN
MEQTLQIGRDAHILSMCMFEAFLPMILYIGTIVCFLQSRKTVHVHLNDQRLDNETSRTQQTSDSFFYGLSSTLEQVAPRAATKRLHLFK